MNVVVDLYDAWGKPDKAAEWRAKLPTEQDAVASDPPAEEKQAIHGVAQQSHVIRRCEPDGYP